MSSGSITGDFAALARMQARLVAMGKAPYKGMELAAIKIATKLRADVSRSKRSAAKRVKLKNVERRMLGARPLVKRTKSGVKIAVTASGDAATVSASGQVQHLARIRDEREAWVSIARDAVTAELEKAAG